MGIVMDYIKTRFNISMVAIFVLIGLFLLLRDVPLLKKQKLNKEKAIAKALGYLYIFGSIAIFIVARMI